MTGKISALTPSLATGHPHTHFEFNAVSVVGEAAELTAYLRISDLAS
jgi:hypothetical protein